MMCSRPQFFTELSTLKSGSEAHRLKIELKYDQFQGSIEDLYCEELNRDYTRTHVNMTSCGAMQVSHVKSTQGEESGIDDNQEEANKLNLEGRVGKGANGRLVFQVWR